MNDDLDMVAGRYEELVGKLQEKYGIAREEAERQTRRFKSVVKQTKRVNLRASKTKENANKRGAAGRKTSRTLGHRRLR